MNRIKTSYMYMKDLHSVYVLKEISTKGKFNQFLSSIKKSSKSNHKAAGVRPVEHRHIRRALTHKGQITAARPKSTSHKSL
jgi:hypothetical protein